MRLTPSIMALVMIGGLGAQPVFDVASVKRNTNNGSVDGVPRRSGDLVTMHNTQVYSMIFYAYHLTGNFQMVGYPDLPEGWRWYDMDARARPDTTDDELRLMMQSLLADRFKLKVHREMREMAQYELTLPAKGTPKLATASDGPMTVMIEERRLTQRPGSCGISGWRDGSHMICHAVGMEKIVEAISGMMRAPVADRTELTGSYDVHFAFVSDDRINNIDQEPGPSLTEALQAELGLRLIKRKGPVEVLVIDHLEKPSEN